MIERVATRLDMLADEPVAETVPVVDVGDLQVVPTASRAVPADEVRLREEMAAAWARGGSWHQIAPALGVSRQTGRQRFTERTPV